MRYVPENSTVGGFAFATANIYGGVIHHDENQPGFTNPLYDQVAAHAHAQITPPIDLPGSGHPGNCKGFSNPLYEAAGNGQRHTENVNNSNNIEGRTTPQLHSTPTTQRLNNNGEEAALDDCLILQQASRLEQVLRAGPEGATSTFLCESENDEDTFW